MNSNKYMLRSVFRSYKKIRPEYKQYVGWSFVSNIAISAQSVMSTHGMLSVVGKASTEIVASYNYVGKDIIGQTCGLWYIHKLGKEADKNTKKFINRSMVLQQSAVFIESCTPLLPASSFLITAGASNVAKNISFTGFGAVNAKIIQKIADDKIGEVYSHVALINSIGSTLGMGLGLLISAQIPSHTVRLVTIFPLLSLLRVYSYKKAIKGFV